MSFQKAMSQLNQGKFANNYLLVGTESYLESMLMSHLKKVLSQEDQVDYAVFDLNEQSINILLDDADQFSFFSQYRMIVVNNPKFLATTGQEKLSDQLLKRIEQYLDNPNPTTVIVWRLGEQTIDKRKKASKVFLKYANYVDLQPLEPKQVVAFVNEELSKRKLELSQDGLNELLKRTLFKLSPIMIEIVKLQSYAMSGNRLSLQVVQALVPRQLETDVFELTRVLIEKQAQKATQIFEDLLLQKHEPIALLGLIISQFRLFIQVKELSGKGYLEQDISQLLGVHSYRVQLANQTAHRFQLEKLYHFYQSLIKIDYQMKTGYLDKETLIYLLIIKTAQL